MKGFKTQPQGGRKERLKQLDVKLTNVEMSSRISQMLVQQLMQSSKFIQEDLGRALGLLNEMQYKILAIQEATGLDVTQLNEIANTKRLKDFNEASDKEDTTQGFTVGDKVEAGSTVILTSKTEETDRGIFRSRIELAKCGVPDLINAFMGQEVGAKAIVKLNGMDHEVELLGVRNPPPPAASTDQTTVVTTPVESTAGTSAGEPNAPVVEASSDAVAAESA
jgi:hypothetical protein